MDLSENDAKKEERRECVAAPTAMKPSELYGRAVSVPLHYQNWFENAKTTNN